MCSSLIFVLARTPPCLSHIEQAVRSNTRLMVKDESLAAVVWDRLKRVEGLLPLQVYDPDTKETFAAVGVNPCFRFCRYHPGQVSTLSHYPQPTASAPTHSRHPQPIALHSRILCTLTPFNIRCTQHFRRHCDFGNEKSMTSHTVNIYLNEGFEGGKTRFYLDPSHPEDPTFNMTPAIGTRIPVRPCIYIYIYIYYI